MTRTTRFDLPPLSILLSAALALVLTPVLLGVHSYDGPGRDFVHQNGWTLFLPMWWYFVATLVWRRGRTLQHAAAVMAVCLVVETLQSVTAPWMEPLRSSLLGGMFLGRGFDSWDVLWYLIGLDLALVMHIWIGRMQTRRSGDTASDASDSPRA